MEKESLLEYIHGLVKFWFQLVHDWGYGGVVFLMALESSIVPVPSEVVMPPAAFWASQGRMNFWLVVLAGTVGSYLGSIISYAISRWAGAPLVALFVRKYGRYVFLSMEKLELAQSWIATYGTGGIFFARLLPVVRHLISIPAGVFKMPVSSFSFATIIGAGLWCFVLSWYGAQVIGGSPELLNSPEELVSVLKDKLRWLVVAVIVLGLLYSLVLAFKKFVAKKNAK